MKNRKNKKAQISVFIILGIMIVVILFMLFFNKTNIISIFKTQSYADQIERCLRDSSQESLDILRLQGGSINPKNYYLYEDNKVDYTCYNQEYYKNCIMQKPLLMQSIKKEMLDYVQPRLEECMSSIKSSLENRGYTISYKKPEITIEIVPNDILIKADIDLRISKSGTDTYKSVQTNLDSNMYEFIMTASSISNWEARYGDSESLNYMMGAPMLKVEKKTQSDGTRIYILTKRDTNEKFMFATRSLAVPPGLIGA